MASDDDDHRRGDKFSRERDYRRDDDRRGDYGYGKRPMGRRDDGANGVKRSRTDTGDYDPVSRSDDSGIMLTFKRFLATQDDDITDEEAISKYSEYKMEFKRSQLQKFFNAHKDEEWFRQKYHPDESKKVAEAHLACLQKRLDIFNDLIERGVLDGIALDQENAETIIRILDTVVVYLEGGTEEQVEMLKKEKIEDESIADLAKEKEKENGETKKEEKEGGNDDGAISDGEVGEKKPKMLLHKTSSVFLRNVPPSVTTEEIEAICKRSPGFLRVAMADVIPERKFFRRAWATYKRDVNIKEICWNLNAIRIRDSDLNAIINRDLTRRLRTTNGIAAHKQVAQNDLRLCAKLAAMLDKRLGLHGNGEQPPEEREKDIRMEVDLVGQSRNPLIKKAKSVLMDIDADEISPEEEELLRRGGADNSSTSAEEKSAFSREESVLSALDQLILYLRIVHSVDFYGHLDYPNEDNMPSRCGILHVRGQPPSGSQFTTSEDGKLMIPNKFVADFIAGFNQRLDAGLIHKDYVTEEEMQKLGKKDGEKEVESFIQQNTVELAKDKWLCPLSGKKFKGPDFIRKHLLTKHEEKLNEVKQEAVFFNNFLSDAKRPQDVEVKPTVPAMQPARDNEDRRDDRYRSSDRSRAPPSRGYGYSGGSRDYGGGRSSGGPGRYFDDSRRGGDSRPQISYRDLDAPEDIP